MPPTEDDVQTGDLRTAMQEILGVEQAVIDVEQRQIVLLLRSDIEPHRVERAAQDLAADAGYDICAAFRPEHRDRQRVRFVDMSRNQLQDQQVGYRITLEWNGREVQGEAVGEKGEAVELRTVAAASLAAVLQLAPDDLDVRLAGVKQVRAFDAELIVISMYRTGAQPTNLVGAVVAGDDPRRAGANAVLSALNRLLGNYLVT